MAELKVVIGTKQGKCLQKDFKGAEAEPLLKKRIGDKFSGDEIGFPGYEFEVTGGSDKCGFPMRKGIQEARKKIMMGKGVGFNGLNREGSKQPGLLRRRTICGERITSIIVQVNLKVIKEGPQKLIEDKPAEEKKVE